MMHTCKQLPGHFEKLSLGVGLGLRSMHYNHIFEHQPKVPWFEAVSENYMGLNGTGPSGRPLEMLERVRRDYPLMLHGVSMNIGSTDPLNLTYLENLKKLSSHIQPLFVSDHLCWTGVDGENLHDLLPLPFTEETIRHVVNRIRQVQDILGRRMVFENVSSYLTFAHSEMTEWEFLCEISARADCGILLDVNNVYVSAINHRFNGIDYLRGIPKDRVVYMHVAGYSDMGNYLVDTHDHPVTPPVWDLYREAIKRFGDVPTLIEWDENIPAFEVLQEEARKAEIIQQEVLHREPVLV